MGGEAWGTAGWGAAGRSAALAVLMMTATAVPMVWPEAAQAQKAEQFNFDIASQPLADALVEFGLQSGYQVTVDGATIRDVGSTGAVGEISVSEALNRLLTGTGFAFRIDGNVVTISQPGSTQPGSAQPESTQLGTITVEGELEVDPADVPFMTPGSSAYISREQIERIPPSSPGDIFKEVPGVLSGASNDGTSINVNIRSAMSLNRVRTMVEGTQQESSGYQGYSGADQRTYIDPELIGGVEISKGPGSGPYATGTTAGTVNVRLLEADDLVPEGENFGFRLRGGIGGNATQARFRPFVQDRDGDAGLRDSGNNIITDDNLFGSIAGAYRNDRFEFVGAYARREEGNYFAGENGPDTFEAFRPGDPEPEERRFSPIEPGQEVPNTSEETRSFFLRGTLRFDDGHSVEAGYNRYDSNFGQIFPSSINLWAPQQFILNEVESNRFWLRYKWNSLSDLIDLQVNLWHTNAEETGEARQAPQENDAWGAEIWNTSFLDTGLGGLSLTYGGEYARSEAVVKAESSFRGFDYVRGPGGDDFNVRGTLSPAFDGSREVFGGYLSAQFEPTDWLTLDAGLRYDRFKAESTSPVYQCEVDFTERDQANEAGLAAFREAQQLASDFSNAAFARYEAGEITFDDFLDLVRSPEAQRLNDAAQDARRAWRAAVNAAEDKLDGFCGTRATDSKLGGDRFSPNFGVAVEPLDGLQLFAKYSEGFRALSLVELGQTFGGPVSVNPDLEPEVVKTWELGVNYLDNGVFLPNDALRAKLVYFNNDYDNFIARGFLGPKIRGGFDFRYVNVPDVTVSGFEGSLSYDMSTIFADLNFTIFDEPFKAGTQASIAQPNYSGTFTLGTRLFDESLTLGSRLIFFGKPYVSGDVTIGEDFYYWRPQQIVDLFGSYHPTDYLSLGFSVENVADRYYIPPLYVSRIPSPGRTFRANFTARF